MTIHNFANYYFPKNFLTNSITNYIYYKNISKLIRLFEIDLISRFGERRATHVSLLDTLRICNFVVGKRQLGRKLRREIERRGGKYRKSVVFHARNRRGSFGYLSPAEPYTICPSNYSLSSSSTPIDWRSVLPIDARESEWNLISAR